MIILPVQSKTKRNCSTWFYTASRNSNMLKKINIKINFVSTTMLISLSSLLSSNYSWERDIKHVKLAFLAFVPFAEEIRKHD